VRALPETKKNEEIITEWTLSRRYIEYCMKKVNMMIHYRVTPVLVFDGCEIPLKRGENAKRNK